MRKIKKCFVLLIAVILCMQMSTYAFSDHWIGINYDRMKKMLYASDFKVFVESGCPEYFWPYYGAKFEPRAGVYLGTPYDKTFPGIQNALNTQYDTFVPSEELKNENCPRVYKEEVPSSHEVLWGYNWNFATKFVDPAEYENYIKNYIDELASWGQDILLVFGKEMNIDDNFTDPDDYIRMFRYVADYAHTKENIAMVWAPNDTGSANTTLEMFYPGDEYVDWIGCSLYSFKYFQGYKDHGAATESINICFIMDDYANPVMRAKVIDEFMRRCNIHKPVMITEGGVGYEGGRYGGDFRDWASMQVRRYYAEIAKVFPQFKIMIHFNNYFEGDFYKYDFYNDAGMTELYRLMTMDPMYLNRYPSVSPVAYPEFYNGLYQGNEIKLSAYAYEPKAEFLEVKYYVDGVEMYSSMYPPYAYTIDSETVPYGQHTIRVEKLGGGVLLDAKEYTIDFAPWQ